MITSTGWLLSFVIPEVVSSVEEQIATLKRTLSKLDMLPDSAKQAVSSGMLKYMQSLDCPEMESLKEYILDALTVMELEGLLSLVEYARERLKKSEYKKSATPSSSLAGLPPGILVSGGFLDSLSKEKMEKWKNAVVDTKDYNKIGDLLKIAQPEKYSKE